jgi:hypothetical protein
MFASTTSEVLRLAKKKKKKVLGWFELRGRDLYDAKRVFVSCTNSL